jgi:glycosyltransferase involved in cell wall biosynthesis
LTLKILALIPAYNESKHIAKVITQAAAFLPVLVVDDGSTDGTSVIVKQTGASLVEVKPNQGKGNALKTGFTWALDLGYDGVLTLDADGQHDPMEIPTFLQEIENTQPDLIIGYRDFTRMPMVRRFANTSGRMLFSWAMRQPIRDNQSGYRYLSARLMQASMESKLSSFEFEVENILTCLQNAMALSWVPIKTIYADEKSHIQPIKHAINFIALVYRVRCATSR